MSLDDPYEKHKPGPVPQGSPAQGFARGASADAKVADPVPQGAPDFDPIAANGKA
ncbi:MAG: hypothetical protein JWM34_2639 [Ilumatobacteraceae bacterium]|nr:hypothetical protein [Ilumatobacteraceae bacterium]